MRGVLLAGLSGALYVLGFAGFDLWPLALFALCPLLWALGDARSPPSAAGLGLVCGTVQNLWGYAFLPATLRSFTDFSWPLCLLTHLALCLYQGAQLALFAVLLALLARRGRDPLLWAAPCFGVIEVCYPLVFPSYLASSLHMLAAPSQIVELGGPSLLSMAIVLQSAALCALLRSRRAGTRPPVPLVAGAPLLALLVVGYGLVRIPQPEAVASAAPSLRVGLVQANIEAREKRTDHAESRRRHVELSRALERTARPDLLVWPETAIAAPLALEVTRLEGLLGGLATPVLFGALSHSAPGGRARLYNSALLVDVDARVRGRVHKRQLLPFAEYVPLGDSFPMLYDWSPHSGWLTPGQGSAVVSLGPHKLAVSICYEALMAGLQRHSVTQEGASLLVNLTNDAWFGDTRAPHIHLALSQLRAIELRRAFVRATNSGVSAIIDPLGRVTAHTAVFEPATLSGRVPLLATLTPFARFGHWPAWVALLAVVFALSRRLRA